MPSAIKVTLSGYDKLISRKEALFRELEDVQGKKGAAAETGGNVWHDNFAFEQLCREETSLNTRIKEISDLINSVEKVEEPIDDQFLQIGHIAVLEFKDGKVREYEIVGFGESDLNATPQKIEYLAPVVSKFFESEIGTTEDVDIAGKIRQITLVKILRKEK